MYTDLISDRLAATGHTGKYNPKHIEGWMRSEIGPLDQLEPAQFDREVDIAREVIDIAGAEISQRLADKYGLGR